MLELDDLSAAATSLADAVEHGERTAGALDPSTLMAHYNLGRVLRRQGHPNAALEHLEVAVAGRTEVLGAQHAQVGTARLARGRARQDLGQALRATD